MIDFFSKKRFPAQSTQEDPRRPPFARDIDKIIFSASFRRLADKRQVFPDYEAHSTVRRRLTHSLEVMRVGRSLGNLVGELYHQDYQDIHPLDVGRIVAAAALVHDVGHPPFGHYGEFLIGAWFKRNSYLLNKMNQGQRAEFLHFDGNAQTFRILTRLEGLSLTCGVLTASVKYPWQALHAKDNGASKKYGLFQEDAPAFQSIIRTIGIQEDTPKGFPRHPLVWLMEAADDICYLLGDLEDAWRMNKLSFDKVIAFLRDLVPVPTIVGQKADRFLKHKSRVIDYLIHQVLKVVEENRETFLTYQGLFPRKPLLEYTSKWPVLKRLRACEQEIYPEHAMDTAEKEIVWGLLRSYTEEKTKREEESSYEELRCVVDVISSMTDREAREAFSRRQGIGGGVRG